MNDAGALSVASVAPYATYVDTVEAAARSVLAGTARVQAPDPMLDGAPSRELAKLLSVEYRRSAGAFFTTSAIRDGAFRDSLPKSPAGLTALDPACGAGDLLIRWSDRLPTKRTLQETLTDWGRYIHGVDCQSEFVRLARARLVLAAAVRCRHIGGARRLADQFPGLVVGDGMQRLLDGSVPAWVLQNPPFGMAPAPSWYASGSGQVSQAAVFVSAWMAGARPGQRMVAILPDVLRTGSRYKAWRDFVEQGSRSLELRSLGQFDSDVLVDVFLLSLRRGGSKAPVTWWPSEPRAHVQDPASAAAPVTVSVGPVVPHRDPLVGPSLCFLTAANLRRVVETSLPEERRCHEGRTFHPPFVVVRRTSRPGQRPRASATVVSGVGEVAVENHLLVVEPDTGGLGECRRIAEYLQSAEATAWLDQRLRGRHLTAVAIRELLGGRE